jgi:ferric-dicitrate binding protein FerR (iron transport regulator)
MKHDAHDDAAIYLAGQADQATAERLNQALQGDAAFRASFVALARMHGHLGEIGQRAAKGVVDSARMLAVFEPGVLAPTTRRIRRRPARSWGGWLAAAAALLAVGLGILTLSAISLRTRPMVPTIVSDQGYIVVGADGSERPASPGMRLRVGDQVQTSARHDSVRVQLHGGRFTLTPGSLVEIGASEPLKRNIRLLSGSIDADLTTADAPLYIIAGDAAVRVGDAATTVRLEPGVARIVVTRGAVAVSQPGAPERLVSDGIILDASARNNQKGASL